VPGFLVICNPDNRGVFVIELSVHSVQNEMAASFIAFVKPSVKIASLLALSQSTLLIVSPA
jgi:hypothetical protein